MTAIKILEELAFKEKQNRYGDQPYLVKRKYSDRSANELTKSIIAYIRLLGGQAERINTTGRVIDGRKTYTDVLGHRRTIGSTKWIPGTGTAGSADISATINGKSVKIEVKYGRDRQSEAQKRYQAEIERAGGIYYVAKTFDDFFHWYNDKFK
ncbi:MULTISPECIES: hypothetical protein [unclassified Proteiniphilum]|jgi:hypothetical protein|uniref:hypothetical protein n=1 Tax=Proteiniphilum sp. UBA5510 TaxID=1947286 RepID=UPI0025808E02|nr:MULTISPECIES: hypothetical protein [unclassified Proteiniphilum]